MTQAEIRSRQKLGKYRLEKRLASGGFADVFRAYDTVEGIRVALKVPQRKLVNQDLLNDFMHEVKLHARLDHPNILPIKNADWVDGRFVIASMLGDGTLSERLTRRMSLKRALEYSDQILAGLAHAHSHRILHCDLKPDNFLLFGEHHLRLTDFGLAKIALKTMHASGSGTIGFMAPEQAMGRPSLRSDVFAAGLILYRMLAGKLPEWPFDWPPPGIERLEKRLPPEMIAFLERSLRLEPKRRFEDAQHMHAAFKVASALALRPAPRRRRRNGTDRNPDWLALRIKHFNSTFRTQLEARSSCTRCKGPVAESMVACPWCGVDRSKHRGETRFPARCKRCKRGVKLDWKYCGWCYGAAIGPASERSYSDKRYTVACPNRSCERRELLPFLRYCPWCRTKVRKPWKIEGVSSRCPRCDWGVLGDHWSSCPWCAHKLRTSKVKS